MSGAVFLIVEGTGRMVAESLPELMLMDVCISGVDGPAMMRRLHERTPSWQ